MNTPEYLDAVKKATGISSDYALSKRLGFSLSATSNYRTGRRILDDDAALTIAQALNIDPIIVIAHVNAERAKTPELRARWLGLVEGFRVLLSQAKFDGVERRRDHSRRLAYR